MTNGKKERGRKSAFTIPVRLSLVLVRKKKGKEKKGKPSPKGGEEEKMPVYLDIPPVKERGKRVKRERTPRRGGMPKIDFFQN